MERGALYLLLFISFFVLLFACLLVVAVGSLQKRRNVSGVLFPPLDWLVLQVCKTKKKEKRRDERLDRTSALRDPPTSFFFLGGGVFSFFTFFSFLYFYFSLFLSLVLWRTLDLYSSVYIRQAGSYTQNKSRHPSAPTDDRIPCAMPRTESLRHQLMSV